MRAGKRSSVDFRSLPKVVARRARSKRVIGFDVFDTLLRRRIEPEMVKDLVARRLAAQLSEEDGPADWTRIRERRRQIELEMGRESEALGADHEFRLREMIERWVSQSSNGAASATLVSNLVDHELRLERIATFPTPHIADTLASLAREGRRLVLLTDIYFDIDDVWDLLRHHRLAEYFAAGYCSSTAFATKRSGRLFSDVLREEGLAPDEFLFVGDNPYSDVDSPRRLGIDVVQVRDAGEAKRRARLQLLEKLSERNSFWIGNLAREIVEGCPTHIKAGRCPDYNLGVLLAPSFLAFTLYIIEQARRLELERLFFFSREGLTFMRMYRRLVRALGIQSRVPKVAYVGVSRASTFLPSLDRLDQANLHRMWRQYDRQSLRRLLRNLSLPPDEFLPLAARFGLTDPDEPIEDLRAHGPFQRFIADPEVQRRFTRHRDRARGLFQQYLGGKGFFDGDVAGVVDIGWKGSIQDNLVRAVRNRDDCPTIHGLYFGLVHIAEDDLPGSHKHAYMADTRRGDLIEEVIFKNGPVFEMFSSAAHGGVVEYRPLAGNPDKVKPIVKAADAERRNFRSYVSRVFEGVEDWLREYLSVAPLIAATSEELKPYVLDQLRRYILYPTGSEARRFLKYSHVESFGVFHESTYEFKGSWRQILVGGPLLDLPKRLVQTLERNFWPEGYLRRLRIPFANVIYDLLETHYGCRVLPDR